jgi:hypothetical protein
VLNNLEAAIVLTELHKGDGTYPELLEKAYASIDWLKETLEKFDASNHNRETSY